MLKYRLDKEDINGNYRGSQHFNTLDKAEQFLRWYKIIIEYENNIIPNNRRYGTIWQVDVIE